MCDIPKCDLQILDLNQEGKKVLENEFVASERRIYDLRKKNAAIQKSWKYQVERTDKLKKENQELKRIIGLQKFKIDEDFVNLKSKYSKLMYKKIHEFRTTEKLQWKIETFRAEFGVPKSYRIDSINERIFKIVRRELTPLFNNFQITKIKKEHKKRHVIRAKVKGIEITWKYVSNQTQLINTTKHSFEEQNKKLLDIAFRVPIEIQKWVMKFKR